MSLSRRRFLRVSATASGGMLIAFHVPACKRRDDPATHAAPATDTPADPVPSEPAVDSELNAWVSIATDDTITIHVDESEMGQGILTALPMIIVDELEGDWSKVRAVHAPLDARYGRQSTGGSTSIRTRYPALRKVGAAAREMLVAAAAKEWNVPASECTAAKSVVSHARTQKSARYGELAAKAAALEPPAEPALKPESEFDLIGTAQKRLDTRSKVDGSAVYGIDISLPEMLVASVEHCPIFGGKVKSFDAGAAKAVAQVMDVVEIPTGVAVVARNTWAAMQGRKALRVVWDGGAAAALDNDEIRKRCQDIVASPKAVSARADGNAKKALGAARTTVRASYEVPYLAHATMEPLGCAARLDPDATPATSASAAPGESDKPAPKGVCELWLSTQSPTGAAGKAAEIAGVDPSAVIIHPLMLGGGFGRRSQQDFVADAVHLAKHFPGQVVKVVWTREDDIRAGYYRPFAYNELEAGLDAKGGLVAWRHRIASPAILTAFGPLPDGVDKTSVEGAANLPYRVPAVEVSYANPDLPIPLWFWRSVGSSQNAYVTEAFFDEVARAAGRDPLDLRRELLADHPRHLGVLERAAKMAGWGTPLAEGRARGIAVHESFSSYVAQVAEVSMESGVPRVHKVFCAVDCGRVINPDTVVAQMESGIIYGLSAALFGRIDIASGRAVQSNFHDYRVVRMSEAPAIVTEIIASDEAPGGIGEPGLPPIAPALANAILALTGEPVRRLPILAT